MDKDIRIVPYSEEYLEQLRAFELPEEQAKFTRLPADVNNLEEWQFPIVILAGDEAVGFFLLHRTERVKEFSGNPKAILLTAFSINHKKQGNGYAKDGLRALPKFISEQFPGCDEIVLAVNHKNIPAQSLYRKVGFIDTGIRRKGPIGEQLIMQFMLTKE